MKTITVLNPTETFLLTTIAQKGTASVADLADKLWERVEVPSTRSWHYQTELAQSGQSYRVRSVYAGVTARNGLRGLVQHGIVRRVDRGVYALTAKGAEMVQVAA